MELRKAAQQALEALELAGMSHDVMLMSDPPQDAWKARGVNWKLAEAINALRAALAKPEPRNQCGETCERAKLCPICCRTHEELEESHRETGLPDMQSTDGIHSWVFDRSDRGVEAVTSRQDWDEIEALRVSLREHMDEIHRLRAAGRQALDAMDYTRWAVADYAQKWGMPRFDRAMNTLRDALEPVTDHHEKEGNKLAPPLAWYDPSNGVISTDKDDPRFTPLGQLWPLYRSADTGKTSDVPETSFAVTTFAVHVGYRYQSPVGGWEYGDHIPAGFDTNKWAHQKIYILQEQA